MSIVLNDVKVYLGYPPANTDFDDELILHINSTIAEMNRFGCGDLYNEITVTETTTWDEIEAWAKTKTSAIKTYIYLSTRLMFDPPTSGVYMDTLKDKRMEAMYTIQMTIDKNT